MMISVVEHECELVVHPSEDPPEVIRVVSEGGMLSVIRASCESHPDYAVVLQDEDTFYRHPWRRPGVRMHWPGA